MAFFNNLLGNIGNVLKQGAQGIGNLFGGGGNQGQVMSGIRQGSNLPIATTGNMPNSVWNGGGGLGGGLGKMFGGISGNNTLKGLGTILGSQLIRNPKAPDMPDSFNEFMNMAKGGGTPGMQSANQYYQGVLSGQNQDMYDAAAHSLDLNYQEELRKLNAMYKTLRPGTDPSSDSTYQRDLSNLNDQYARARAQTMAQVQQGAAQGLTQTGALQSNMMAQGIEAQINQIASQWGMSYAQRDALRKQLMGLGAYQITGPQGTWAQFADMFGGRA